MFEATQWKTPLSSARSPVICRTPLGSNVYLLGREIQLTTSTATGTIGHRDTASQTQPSTQILSQGGQRHHHRHTQINAPAIPALTTIAHSPFCGYIHEHQIWFRKPQGYSVSTQLPKPHPGAGGQSFKAQALGPALCPPSSVLARGSPLIVCINWDSVLLPHDQGFGKPVDLALEAGHATLLAHDGLGMHVEVRHGW